MYHNYNTIFQTGISFRQPPVDVFKEVDEEPFFSGHLQGFQPICVEGLWKLFLNSTLCQELELLLQLEHNGTKRK